MNQKGFSVMSATAFGPSSNISNSVWHIGIPNLKNSINYQAVIVSEKLNHIRLTMNKEKDEDLYFLDRAQLNADNP